MQDIKKITYKQKMSGGEVFKYIKAVGLPIFTFFLALIVITSLKGFGTKLIAPCTALMWCFGVFCAFFLPSHRNSIMNETYITVGVYLITLEGITILISWLSGVSSETLMAVFNQSISATSGSAIAGWMQNLLYITAVMTPLGYIGMQGKRLYSFKKKSSKEKFLEQARGIRKGEGHLK